METEFVWACFGLFHIFFCFCDDCVHGVVARRPKTMSDVFVRHLLGIAIGQICGGAGFQSMRSEPLRTMQDITEMYILQLSQTCQSLAEVAKRRSVNLCDVSRAFGLHEVKLVELDLFLHEVEEIPFMGPIIETIPRKRENTVFDNASKIPLHMDRISDIRELEMASKSSTAETTANVSPVKANSATALIKTATTSSQVLNAYRKAVKTVDQTIQRVPLSSSMAIDEVSRTLVEHTNDRMISQESESLKFKIKLGGGD